jgi:hypothetical protein
MGDSAVLAKLRERVLDAADSRVAAVRMRREHFRQPVPREVLILFFALQRIGFNAGSPEERGLELRAFMSAPGAEPFEVSREAIGPLVRDICEAERQTRPAPSAALASLAETEKAIVATLLQTVSGSPTAVWPIACVVAAVT